MLIFTQVHAVYERSNDQYLHVDQGVEYSWTFEIEEINSNGDNLNESIAVVPSVVFNTSVESYLFDLTIVIY